MNKYVFAIASLLAATALACGEAPTPESDEDVVVDTESSVDVQAYCYQAIHCTSNGRTYSSTSSCRSACGTGHCINEGYCCGGRCVYR